MKQYLIIIILCSFFFNSNAQNKLIGKWIISHEKNIQINEDFSFVLSKGTHTHLGTWRSFKKKNEKEELVLSFKTKDLSYNIEKVEKDFIELYDQSKNLRLALTRAFQENETSEHNTKFEVNRIPKGSFIINPGIGLFSYIDSLPSGLQGKTPPLSLLLEHGLGNRLGLGIKVGHQSWENPEINQQTKMYALSSRLTYHPKAQSILNPYFGAAAILRLGTMSSSANSSFKWSYGFSPVVGIRYYVSDNISFTGEFAYDSTSNITLGFAFLIPK